MSESLYKFSRQLIIILSIFLCISLFKEKEILRMIMYIILTILYIMFSYNYQKKRYLFTIPYIYTYLVLFLVYTYVPALITQTKINELNNTGTYGYWMNDEYNIYFIVMFIVYLILNIYITFSKYKINEIKEKILISDQENARLNLGCYLLCILYIITKRYEIMVIILTCIISKLLFKKNYKKTNIILAIPIILIGAGILTSRYKIIGIILPLIAMFIIMNHNTNKKVSIGKLYLIAALGFSCIMLYGIISEVYKLNTFYSGTYSLKEIFNSFSLIFYFVERQIYRIIGIWTKLGGYIIYHVKNNGYFYGLTYIKSLSSIFNFEYISLPKIAAVYDQANYAQPGLLAEGFANFGVLGAILNLIIVFLVMEITCKNFYKEKKYTLLLIATVPFTQILLDGGTLNSAIMMIGICIVLYIIVNYKDQKIILKTRRDQNE